MGFASVREFTPRLSVELDGFADRFPAVRFNSSFELNSIPIGSVTLALGNEFLSSAPAPVHQIADLLAGERRKIKVLLTMIPAGGAADPDLELAAGAITVFDGFTSAVAPSFANGSAQYAVQMVHWLDDLNFSSVFSKTSHPANPGDYTFGALSGGPAGRAGGGPDAPTGRNWTGLTHAEHHFTGGNVESDLWLAALRPWFEELCAQDAFEADEIGAAGRGAGANDQALAALARMGAGRCYVPLALDLDVDADTGDAIAHSAARMTMDPGALANITIWDTLVAKFAAEYLFAVVPLVSRALVVPFIPGYRTPFKTIAAAQETQIEWTSTLNRTLRGMGVLATMEMVTGAGVPNAEANIGIGGFYSPDPEGPGQVQTRGGPDWITRISASRKVDESVGAAGQPIADGMVPAVPAPPPDPGVAGRVRKVKKFLDQYAQALYALEMIRGRQAVAAGPVRFDIAPGSTVLVYPGGSAAVVNDRLKAPFYATVARVSTYLDAEAVQAGTGFHLAHCRSEKENASDRTSVAKHPLYRESFSGCGLVD